MCLVEIEKLPKPVTACTVSVGPEMSIHTDSLLVQKARESSLELFLANHPLDCPICDQAGECDLQEQVANLCSDKGRSFTKKRAVEDRNCGPLIKTVMTRCIHCTRCTRFSAEVAGSGDVYLGTTNRGFKTEITTFVGEILQNEFSGNLIDLCPVGALTSKPYIFNGRPWESKVVESIDVFDSLGASIKIEHKELHIIRILPRLNKNFSLGKWISDKVRFSFDGLYKNRLTDPLKFNRQIFTYEVVSWYRLINAVEDLLCTAESSKVCFVIGNTNDLETSLATKLLAESLGVLKIVNDSFSSVDTTFPANYSFDLKLLNKADCFLLVGTNPRVEACLLNLQIEARIKKNAAISAVVGAPFKSDSTMHKFLGLDLKTFFKILEGKHSYSKAFKKAKLPIIICGFSLLGRVDSRCFFNAVYSVNTKVKIFGQNSVNLLLPNSNDVGNLNLGISPFSPEILKGLEIVFLVHPSQGVLDYLTAYCYLRFSSRAFFPTLIYQGSHFPLNYAHTIDYFLPGKTFVEKEGSFCNIENTCQKTSKVFDSIGNTQACEDSLLLSILRAFFTNKPGALLLDLIPSSQYPVANFLFFDSFNVFSSVKINKTPLKLGIEDFYLTHTVSQNSTTMSRCSANNRKRSKNFLVRRK